jgi:hypothetical protein
MYYIPWCLTDATTTACGLAYGGKDDEGNNKWDRVY